jgi:hypothetical protein
MGKKKAVKDEVKEVETKVEVKEEINPEAVECPTDACQELQDLWMKGILGAYEAKSKACKTCEKDFPETFNVCKVGTPEKTVKVAKAKKERVSTKEYNEWKHGITTQAAVIDNKLMNGGFQMDLLVAELIDLGLSNRDKGIATKRVQSHIQHLKKDPEHGFKIVQEKGFYKIAEVEA